MEGTNTCTCTAKKLSACALGFAIAITSALFMLIFGVAALSFGFGVKWIEIVSSIYVGFAVTPVGILIGALWAFVEGYIFGFVMGLAYNLCVKHCQCKSCAPKEKVEQVVKEE